MDQKNRSVRMKSKWMQERMKVAVSSSTNVVNAGKGNNVA